MSRRAPLSALVALALAACGSGQAAAPPSPATVGDVGELPATFPTAPTGTLPETAEAPVTTAGLVATSAEPPPTDSAPAGGAAAVQPVGRLVAGNRVLIIGDSILASTSRRYGNDMCQRLVPMGWAVELDAETGQQIGFGREVLGQRLRSGWDTAVIMLGNNYGGEPQPYADELGRILDQLAPRPVVLLTVTEFREDRAEVNYVIRSMAAQRDNVRVVEWGDRTRDADELLGADGLHLSNAGRVELAAMTSRALGRAPSGSKGECLSSRYTDDSAGPVDGPSGRSSGNGTGRGGSTGSSGGASSPNVATSTTPTTPTTQPPPPAPPAPPPAPPASAPPPAPAPPPATQAASAPTSTP